MGKVLAALASIAIFIGAFGGWVTNILKLIAMDVFTVEALIRAIGIVVAPIGVVMGFI